MKVIHHTLECMTGRGIQAYIPETFANLDNLDTVELTALHKRFAIRVVEDEETSQTKAWGYLFSAVKMRGEVQPEVAHSFWNSMKNGLKCRCPDLAGDLQTSQLKLTIAANFRHGAFRSGDKLLRIQEVTKAFLDRRPPSWLYNFFVENGEEDPVQLVEDMESAPAFRTKGKFVP